jgi:hypothetical protein
MPKTYRYATLDDVIDALNQGARVSRADVRPSLLSSRVHVGFYGMGGGYLPDDSSHCYARSRRAIVDSHCDTVRYFDEADRAPAGFRASLMRGESAYSRDGSTCFELDCVTLGELIGD